MNEKLHILIISSWFPTESQPYMGNFIKRQAELLAVDNIITVINTIGMIGDKLPENKIIENGHYQEYQIFFKKSKSAFLSKWREFKVFKKKLLQIEKPDLIHAHILFPKGWQFSLAKKYFKCPLILTDQASYYHKPQQGWRGKYQEIFLSKYSKDIDYFVAVSDVIWEDVQKYFSTVSHSIIPNHVDYELFRLKDKNTGKIKFLHISTLDERFKDPNTLINGISELLKMTDQFHFTIVSDENYDKWQAKCDELKISAFVTFDGPMNWSQIAETYAQHDVFVLTSEYETFSIVLAEALASGLPVVTTPVGIGKEFPENISKHFKIGDVKSLADAMYSVILNYSNYNAVEIRAYAEKFSGKIVNKKLVELYKKILRKDRV